MEFFVDIADIEKVEKVAEYFPIDGFTTNPNILTKSDRSLSENMRIYQTKVLGASFRTADEIERLAAVGCHAVTITPEFFDLLITHPSTDVSLSMFRHSWKDHFGDAEITDGLN